MWWKENLHSPDLLSDREQYWPKALPPFGGTLELSPRRGLGLDHLAFPSPLLNDVWGAAILEAGTQGKRERSGLLMLSLLIWANVQPMLSSPLPFPKHRTHSGYDWPPKLPTRVGLSYVLSLGNTEQIRWKTQRIGHLNLLKPFHQYWVWFFCIQVTYHYRCVHHVYPLRVRYNFLHCLLQHYCYHFLPYSYFLWHYHLFYYLLYYYLQ